MEKTSRKEKKRTVTTQQKMSSKIIRDFLRFNLFFFALLLFLYLLLMLAVRQYAPIYDLITGFLTGLFGKEFCDFVVDHTFIAILAVYLVFFVFSCLGYSISTLINFDKTWLSLSAILVDEAEVKKFSKNFSDIEITLKDIKHFFTI